MCFPTLIFLSFFISMEVKKTIQVNPDFFKIKRGRSRKEKKTKPKLQSTLKPNNIKKQLLARIKNFQKQKNDEAVQKEKSENQEEFKKDFDSSLDYLQKMIHERKNKKQRKRTRKKQHAENTQPQISTPTKEPVPVIASVKAKAPQITKPATVSTHSPSLQRPDPPYGNLKNGTKPTYSEYRKTLKNKKKPKVRLPPMPEPSPTTTQRQERLDKIKRNLATPKIREIAKLINRKRTLKIFRLGKKDRKVGVLIKCGKTRKKIQTECDVLKRKRISDIKKYLRSHNLIKIGSTAPEDVMRKLYEDARLSGDIYNKNIDYLMHNYMAAGS